MSININKLLQSFTGKTKTNSMNIVAQRFLQVFHDHGVKAAQIPHLLPQVKLNDLKSEDALLAILTPDLLDKTAHLFGVRSQWLEGVDDNIYEYLSCYKQPELFFEKFASLHRGKNDFLSFPIRAIATTKKFDYTDPDCQPLALVMVEQVALLDDKVINRYHVYRDGWDWSYSPARIQVKAMIRVITDSPVPIFIVTPNEMEKLHDGELIPHRFVDGCKITSPSLEDYVQTSSESVVAKEVDEIPDVLRYIEELRIKIPATTEMPQSSQPIEPVANNPQDEPTPVVTVNRNASNAAIAKNAPINAIKKRFVSFHETQGCNYVNKTAAVGDFFDHLNEKEKLQFNSKDTAIRTLLAALRKHLQETKLSE